MGDGEKIVHNLDDTNVYRDDGEIDYSVLDGIEEEYQVKLPDKYSRFITKHNGARLNIDSFDFYDVDIEDNNNACIAFIKIQKIPRFINALLLESVDDPEYFPERLIPFGDDGGGNYMCFDYRNCYDNNPPIIYWNHDVYENNKRISFIAHNFEEFINMLHEPEDV